MNIFRDSYGKSQLTKKQILTDPVLFLAFGFGSGLSKKAPGTCGTLAALPVYYLLAQTNFIIYSLATIISMIAGIYICDSAAKKLNEHDYGGIVWDEIAGYLITLWFVPFSWQAMAIGFVLFRIFDIVKPQPIKWIDAKVHGGFGIMLDDIIAAVFAGILLFFLNTAL
ncbi:MAG: phosphatidylglycerophosphatase A [Methylococcaceae bacterium]